MNWEDYTFIYKDSLGTWNIATNPVFIAEHGCCMAIKKTDTDTLNKYLGKPELTSEYIIDEYDTQKTILVTRDIKDVADKVEELRKHGLSNYRISEMEIIDGEDFPVLTMNLDEFGSISHLRSMI